MMGHDFSYQFNETYHSWYLSTPSTGSVWEIGSRLGSEVYTPLNEQIFGALLYEICTVVSNSRRLARVVL